MKLRKRSKILIIVAFIALLISSVIVYVNRNNSETNKKAEACICGAAGGVTNEPCSMPPKLVCL